jgi:hypothetical protein
MYAVARRAVAASRTSGARRAAVACEPKRFTALKGHGFSRATKEARKNPGFSPGGMVFLTFDIHSAAEADFHFGYR